MTKPPLKKRILRALAFPFVLFAALLLWLEEWLWEPLGNIMRWFGSLPIIRNVENLVRRAPPWLALACFAIPLISMLPFKLAGLWLFGKGHVFSGVGVFLSAKVVGTALGARIFALTQPSLMQLQWFARLWVWFISMRERIYVRVKEHPAWLRIKEKLAAMKAWVRAHFH